MKTLNFKLNPLPVYDDRYIKTKIRKYGDKVSINFRGVNKLEDDLEFESFTVIYSNSLLILDNKHYLQVCLENCAYKVVNKT